MNFRELVISIGCCAAALGLGIGKPARAGELQSGSDTLARGNERCTALQSGSVVADSCERIGGHVRVGLAPRFATPPGYGRPGASPVAVRIDDGTPSRSHLRLPPGEAGMDTFAR